MSDQLELDCGEASMADMLTHADELPQPAKWAVTLAEMVDVLSDDNGRHYSLAPTEALAHAQRAVLILAEHFGARPLYLPRGDALRIALRDRGIFLEWNGRNKDALATRHGLSTRSIERIYVEQRALQIRRRQGRLFDVK